MLDERRHPNVSCTGFRSLSKVESLNTISYLGMVFFTTVQYIMIYTKPFSNRFVQVLRDEKDGGMCLCDVYYIYISIHMESITLHTARIQFLFILLIFEAVYAH